jgi:hypothetical protein
MNFFAQHDGNVLKWLKGTNGLCMNRQLVYIWLHMLLIPGWSVYSKLKSGPVKKPAFAVVQNWAAQVTMTSNHLIIQACALRSLSKCLVLGVFAQEERSELLQLILDEDAKPPDALGDSSDSSKGSGNGSKSS